MKKNVFLAAIAALALTSCIKNENAFSLDNTKNEISFSSYSLNVAKDTKATELATTAANFGVFALYHEEGEAWAAADQNTAENYIVNTEVSYNATDGIWKPAAKYYWPTKGSLSFVAYSPYALADASFNKATNTLTVPATAMTSGMTLSSDVMYSSVAAINKKAPNDVVYVNGGKSSNGVALLFKHIGAKVIFKAQLAKEITTAGDNGIGATINIKKIVVKSVVKTTADASLSVVYDVTGASTATLGALGSTTTDSFTVFDTTTGTEVFYATATDLLGNALYVIPQNLGAIKIDVTYSIQNGALASTLEDVTKTDVVLTATDNEWKSGYQYTYTLKLADDLQEVWFSPSEEEWNTVNKDVDINVQ